jgi:hypothetical protein
MNNKNNIISTPHIYLQTAKEFLQSAFILTTDGNQQTNVAEYCLLTSIEISLKSFICSKGNQFKPTHKINLLYSEASNCGLSFDLVKCFKPLSLSQGQILDAFAKHHETINHRYSQFDPNGSFFQHLGSIIYVDDKQKLKGEIIPIENLWKVAKEFVSYLHPLYHPLDGKFDFITDEELSKLKGLQRADAYNHKRRIIHEYKAPIHPLYE